MSKCPCCLGIGKLPRPFFLSCLGPKTCTRCNGKGSISAPAPVVQEKLSVRESVNRVVAGARTDEGSVIAAERVRAQGESSISQVVELLVGEPGVRGAYLTDQAEKVLAVIGQ